MNDIRQQITTKLEDYFKHTLELRPMDWQPTTTDRTELKGFEHRRPRPTRIKGIFR